MVETKIFIGVAFLFLGILFGLLINPFLFFMLILSAIIGVFIIPIPVLVLGKRLKNYRSRMIYWLLSLDSLLGGLVAGFILYVQLQYSVFGTFNVTIKNEYDFLIFIVFSFQTIFAIIGGCVGALIASYFFLKKKLSVLNPDS